MRLDVMLVVLFAAFLHAGWNALIKSGTHKLRDAGLIALTSGLIAAVALPFMPSLDPACYPWLATSFVIHQLYFVLVAAVYRAGDMGQTYPLMRGSAPLLVALASGPLLGETLTPAAWAGVALISSGILLLALHRHSSRNATLLALLNAVFIALYTLVDGQGARLSGAPFTYALWLCFAPFLLSWLFRRDRAEVWAYMRGRLGLGLLGGAATIASYALALWAMTQAPVATVAALRETSVIFAVAISTLVLGERGGRMRLAAALIVAAGAAVLRLA